MRKHLSISRLAMLPEKDSGLHNLIVRINGRHINGYFKRRDPVVIVNKENGEKIIRYALGHGSLPGITKEAIAVDYDGIVTLGFCQKKLNEDISDCNLIVRKPRIMEKYLFFTRHPDLGIQLSIRLGLVGCFLGMVGLFLGVISLT